MDKGKGREQRIPQVPHLPPPFGSQDDDLYPWLLEQGYVGPLNDIPFGYQSTPQGLSGQASNFAGPNQPQLPIMQEEETAFSYSPEELNPIDPLIYEYDYQQLFGDLPPSPQAPNFDDLLYFDPMQLQTGHTSQQPIPLQSPRNFGKGDGDLESRTADIPQGPKVIDMERFGRKTDQTPAILSPHDRTLLRVYLDTQLPMRELQIVEERRQWQKEQKDRNKSALKARNVSNPIVIEDDDDDGGGGRTTRAQIRDKGKKPQRVSRAKKPEPATRGKKSSEVEVEVEKISGPVEKSGYQYVDGSTFTP